MDRYIDPNHILSIYNQLEIGIRSIEIDVHWTLNTVGLKFWENWKKRLLLCHGKNDHKGCSPVDRHFTEGLSEVSSFLRKPENANEVLIIYIEDHMDGKYDKAISHIQSTIGDLVYRPQSGCYNCRQPHQAIPRGKMLVFKHFRNAAEFRWTKQRALTAHQRHDGKQKVNISREHGSDAESHNHTL